MKIIDLETDNPESQYSNRNCVGCSMFSLVTSWAYCFSRFQAATHRSTLDCAEITAWSGDGPGQQAHKIF